MLEEGRDVISEIPADRWNIDDYYHPSPSEPGKMSTRFGAFLEQIDQFDAQFFGITPREASRMDPQQRLLLELSWEAFENAGLAPDRLVGSDVAVFAGITTSDYSYLQIPDIFTFNGHAGMGGGHCIATGRMSYFYDFHGPNAAVDTACSSSLVAIHMACQSLRNGECSAAIAGGVNVMIAPHCTVFLSEWGVLAPDGRCKTFDSSADGFGRGEGCGFVVLKRLADAQADGDNILGVIRGTALNQDGRGTRLSASNATAQQAVVKKALADAGVDPSQISYIEMHGTGTPIGDPIEVEALTASVGMPRPDGDRCGLGSVKANVGHLEAAAGVAGLMKAVLCMQHNMIPKQLHLKQLNPSIHLEGTPFYVPTENIEWPAGDVKRYAGISSFGLSGTNSHVILEEAPAPRSSTAADEHSAHLLVLSARSTEALKAVAAGYEQYLQSETTATVADICSTAALRRSHHPYRAAVVGHTRQDLLDRVSALSDKDFHRPPASTGMPERIALVFSGQGSQWSGMGRDLLESEPVFRAAVTECDAEFLKLSGISLLAQLQADEATSRLGETEVAQPSIFAIQAGLLALYRSWGIPADAVVGHSSGEVAAAYAAGILSLSEALRVMYHRSRLMQRSTGQGRMAALGLTETDARAAIAGHANLEVAAVNGPGLTVVAGESAAIAEVLKDLRTRGVFSRDLGVNYAFHSYQMDPVLDELKKSLKKLTLTRASVQFISTVTGGALSGPEMDAGHWASNIRKPVRFAQAIDYLVEDGFRVFLEVGPRPVLATPMTQCLTERGEEGTVLASLREGQDGRTNLLKAVGWLFVAGCPLDWQALEGTGNPVILPNYPWQYRRHWLPSTPTFTRPLVPEPEAGQTYAGSASAAEHGAHTPDGKEVISTFYDRVSSTAETDEAFLHLTFAPFLNVAPGFSWIMSFYQPESSQHFAELTKAAHAQMRQVLFRGIDFQSIHSVLDFGCGYGTDLLRIAGENPHLICDGYTLSGKQADLGNRKALEAGAQDRVALYQRDSAEDEFPRQYDLVFGFEVAHYINDKHKLFSHIDRHLNDGGFLVLADFIANTVSEIRHDATNSFFPTLDQWCDLLADYKLRVAECVDVSQEMANFLFDPEADKNLALLAARMGNEGSVREHFTSYDGLGKLFCKKLATYGLITIQKDRFLSRSEIYRLNKERLSRPTPYSEVVLREGIEDNSAAAAESALGETVHWLYEPVWQAMPRPQSSSINGSSRTRGTWLLLADGKGVGRAAAEVLAARGERCVLVTQAEQYSQLQPGQFTVNARRPEDFSKLLADALPPGSPGCRGIVHLWGNDVQTPQRTTLHSLEADQARAGESLINLLQAVDGAGWDRPPALWIATSGVHLPNSGSPTSVAQAPLWGIGRTIAAEVPAVWGGLVDLDPGTNVHTSAQQLTDEILTDQPEDQIAYSGGHRYVWRIRPRPELGTTQMPEIVADGTYLITGGLGGLGLETGRLLVDLGARNLVFLQRSHMPERSEWAAIDPGDPQAGRLATILELEAAGATVRIISADVAREDEMAVALGAIRREMPPIHGVIHGAGIVDDGVLLQMEPAKLGAVAAPKVSGAWNLHRLTLSDPLDFFVLFSSGASLLGPPGQANYSAANAGLDALAHLRHREGLPAVSINWGPWAEVGMAAAEANRGARVAQKGVRSIPVKQGLNLLAQLLGGDRPQVLAVDLDIDQLRQSWPRAARAMMLSELGRPPAHRPDETPKAGTPASDPEVRHVRATVRQSLDDATPQERGKLLEGYLREQTARVLELSVADVAFREPLNRMGIDSLMAVELRNVIEQDLGVTVELVSFLEGGSLSDMATELLSTQLNQGAPQQDDRLNRAMDLVDQMSDDAVEALLAEKRRQLAR